MKCTRCGFNNYDGIKICKNCGAILNNSLLNQQQMGYNNYNGYATNNTNNTNNNYNGYNSGYNNAYNTNNNNYNTYNNQPNINNLQYQPIKEDYNNIKLYKEKKPIGKFIAVATLVIFMVALLIGVVYLYLENHGIIGKNNKPTTNQVQETIEQETIEQEIIEDEEIDKEMENEKVDEITPTPTQEPTSTPTPTQIIDKDSFFGKVENLENYKLIGSKNVGYMIVPYDVNIVKMETNSIAYANSNNSAMIYIAAYKQEEMTLHEQSLVIIDSIENGQYFAQDIRTNGGVVSNCEYINIRATYPNENVYLNGYLVKFNNDIENTYRWIEIKYTIENLNDYANLFNNYTIKIIDEVPSSLYNESDHF